MYCCAMGRPDRSLKECGLRRADSGARPQAQSFRPQTWQEEPAAGLPRTHPDTGRLGPLTREELEMHKDEIKGAARDAKGSIKEAAGKATGNNRLAAEGAS